MASLAKGIIGRSIKVQSTCLRTREVCVDDLEGSDESSKSKRTQIPDSFISPQATKVLRTMFLKFKIATRRHIRTKATVLDRPFRQHLQYLQKFHGSISQSMPETLRLRNTSHLNRGFWNTAEAIKVINHTRTEVTIHSAFDKFHWPRFQVLICEINHKITFNGKTCAAFFHPLAFKVCALSSLNSLFFQSLYLKKTISVMFRCASR